MNEPSFKKPPVTLEEMFQDLAQNPNVNKNWLEDEAVKAGVDFDQDPKDEFNRNNLE
jgi:hypothetical protein